MSENIIEISGLSKSYGGVVANKDISINVKKGGITGLIGPNGSGKTTLFNSIVGFHPIDAGSIKFSGQEISQFRVQQIARLGLLRTFQQTRIYGKTCKSQFPIARPVFGICSPRAMRRRLSAPTGYWNLSGFTKNVGYGRVTFHSASKSYWNLPWL